MLGSAVASLMHLKDRERHRSLDLISDWECVKRCAEDWSADLESAQNVWSRSHLLVR